MTLTLLNLSQHDDLKLEAQIVGAVVTAAASVGASPLIVGAFARDLHLLRAHGIATQRGTEDLDFGFWIADWPTFERLKHALVASQDFKPSPTATHRLRHTSGLPIDLVPFGDIESEARTIHWPPSVETVMDTFGFQEALRHPIELVLPGNVRTNLISLPALALLKLVCWKDRHYTAPRKDAQDLRLILTTYLEAGNSSRLFDEHNDWLIEDDFRYERAGPRLLGQDVAMLLDTPGKERVASLLAEQSDMMHPARLAAEMSPADPESARALLEAMHHGLMEERPAQRARGSSP